MSKQLLIVFSVCLLLLAGCNRSSRQPVPAVSAPLHSLQLKYAHGFSVDYYQGYKLVTVRDLVDSTKMITQYLIATPDAKIPTGLEAAVRIAAPVRKVVCVSTTHIATLARLGLLDSIAGVTNLALIYDSTVTGKVNWGQIANLGNDEVNYEKLVELAPSFVITSGGYDGGDKLKVKLSSLLINSVIDLDYKEQNPLARAEWIKFLAVFYDKEEVADSIFKRVEANYLSLKDKVKNVTVKPTSFCNLPFKEAWYMPCGENYMAMLIQDAGGDFMWKDAAATNGLNLNLDYEAVYAKAAKADYWLNTGFANSLDEIKAADVKNTFFKAYSGKTVYNNNKRNTPVGGFDFWESGTVNPDLVLADLIYIFHPELMPGHELYYYQKLK